MKYIILILILFMFSPIASMGADIIIAADQWPPFNDTPGSEHEGYMVDIAKEVFAAAGLDVEYRILPWQRALNNAMNGEIDGVIGASKRDALGFIFPEQELAVNFLSFCVIKESPWRFTGIESLQTVKLGVIKGYDYRDWLNKYIESAGKEENGMVKVMTGNDPLKRNLHKLITGRLDVVVDTEAAIRWIAKSNGILEQIKIAGYGSEPAYCYIAFSPRKETSKKYAAILSEGIERMRASGRLHVILARYGLKDWRDR